jgi:peroxidase
VGVLAEKPFKGGAIGQTGHEIIERQFEALRDGDRFYFENTQNGSGFSKHEIKEIKATSFQDILAQEHGTSPSSSTIPSWPRTGRLLGRIMGRTRLRWPLPRT